MSAASEPDGTERAADHWLWAVIWYVFAYSLATIIFGLAEPTRDSLVYPAIGVAAVVKLAGLTERVPETLMANVFGILLPVAATGVVVWAMA